MFLPGQNKLARPEVLAVPGFEDLLRRFKQVVVDHIAEGDEDLSRQVRDTLSNEAELSTKILEACCKQLQSHVRKINDDAAQMFAYWAKSSNLDAKVSDLGLKRQVIKPGDPDAFPSVPDVTESDDHLRRRYFLAPYSFSNAGSRLGYKYHALTLGERPNVSVGSPESGRVVVEYRFSGSSVASRVKDSDGVRVADGVVSVPVLAWSGDGVPDTALLADVRDYFQREDVAPETDRVEVVAAELLRYRIKAVAFINAGPDGSVVKTEAGKKLQRYVTDRHRLGGEVDPDWVKHFLIQAGATKVQVDSPASLVSAGRQQAPYCESIDIEIRRL